jgi:hypothetical protein
MIVKRSHVEGIRNMNWIELAEGRNHERAKGNGRRQKDTIGYSITNTGCTFERVRN